MSTHAKLSASGSHRWLHCPGSVAAEAACGPSASSMYAEEGSVAHELAELCLTSGDSPFAYEGQTLPINNALTVTREMCSAVQDYIDYVRTVPGSHEYEQRVDFSDWVPGGFGTSDMISVHGDTIYVADLKYGKGYRVDALNNSQLMLYALGAYAERAMLYDLRRVKMTIVQPRLDHISEHEMGVDELLKWGAWVTERAEIANSESAERVPGEQQCHFCAAKATCPALDAYTRKVLSDAFDDLCPPDRLGDERLREVLQAKKLITGWLDAVEQHVTARLEAGEGFPGFKLVAGKSNRQWHDEASAQTRLEALLADKAFEHKLVSPAKAEAILGKKRVGEIADLIIKPEGKLTLAPESDPRPARNLQASDFDALHD